MKYTTSDVVLHIGSEGCDLKDDEYMKSLDNDYRAFLAEENEKEEQDEDYEQDEYLEETSDDYNLIGTDNKGVYWWAHESGGCCLIEKDNDNFYTATPLLYALASYIYKVLRRYKWRVKSIPFFHQLLIILFLKRYWENKKLEMWSGYENTKILTKYIKNKEKLRNWSFKEI